MLKIPKKISLLLSIGLSVALLPLCGVGVVIMPKFIDKIIDIRMPDISDGGRLYMLVLGYVALCFVVFADLLMLALLTRVRNGLVFTPASVALIRAVSWCSLILSALLCGLGVYFPLSFVVAFGGVFLGLCLRVVKNVIEEATEIKQENDLTV